MSSIRTVVAQDWDLYLAVTVVALGAASSVADTGLGVLTVLLLSPLVLFLPGYTLIEALRPPHLDVLGRLVTSIAMSFAVVILLGIALNWLPGGIARASELGSLSGITILAAAVAWFRRRTLGRGDEEPRDGLAHVRLGISARLWVLLSCALAIALVAAGLGVARRAAIDKRRIDAPTQLWLMPDPTVAGSVRVGVRNAGKGEATYRLQLTEGSTVVKQWQSIALPPGATWSARVSVPPPPHHRLQAALYLAGRHAPIRRAGEAETQ